MKAKSNPFTLKQLIVIILTKPEVHTVPTPTNPTIAYIQRGLKIYFNKTASIRQIRQSLSELENEGVLARRIIAQEPGPGNGFGRASYYVVVHFNDAFQNITALKDESRKSKRREKRRKITLQRIF